MDAETLARASRASLLATVAFHYTEARLRYLFEVLRALEEFPLARLDVLVQTNAEAPEQLARIAGLWAGFPTRGKSFAVRRAGPLAHPFDLTWCHKAVMRDEFLREGAPWTHFLYIEDDLRFTFRNFCYWIEARDALAPHGLLPSFIRIEFNERNHLVHTADQRGADVITGRASLRLGPSLFLALDNPHTGLFVMDRALAAEHLASKSSDPVASEEVCGFHVRERAAMGLCWDRPPPGWHCRHAVPLDAQTLVPETRAWVHHLPNTYTHHEAHDAYYPFGKTRVDRAFACVLTQRLGNGYFTWGTSPAA